MPNPTLLPTLGDPAYGPALDALLRRSLAERLARHAHRDQVDKAGQPYVGHLERVVGHLLRLFPDATDDEIAAAWLHDVVEDGHMDRDGLAKAGVPWPVARTVLQVTRWPGVAYSDHIGGLEHYGPDSAIRVKLADLADNSDPARLALIPEGASLGKRYRVATALLRARLGMGERDA